MKPVQRILLALDLAPGCRDVWAEACAVARLFGAEVHVLHAVTDAAPGTPEFARAARWAEGQLDGLVRCCAEAGARVSPHYFIRALEAGEAILATARDAQADLIVMGAGPPATLGHVFFGNAAERVVREAPVPVWVVHPGRGHARFQRVVAAVDPAAPQRDVLHAAGLVARAADAHLKVVTVVRPAGGEDEGATLARLRAALEGTAAEGLDLDVEVRPRSRTANELVRAAGEAGADLLVVGERARRGVRRLFDRDTVDKVLRVAPCSILRVRPAARRAAVGVP